MTRKTTNSATNYPIDAVYTTKVRFFCTLAEELSTTVHALALHTYTIKEWEGLQDTVFASPPCRGAGSIA